MKIIFLDFDGVLNIYPQGSDKYGDIFHQHFIDNLKHIIDKTGAKIVISSSWRCGMMIDGIFIAGLEIMQQMWKDRNYPGEIIGVTPDYFFRTGSSLQRGKEIDGWIESYPSKISNYVILDDDTDMEPHQLINFVQTSKNYKHSDCVDIGYGLTKECSEQAILILNKI